MNTAFSQRFDSALPPAGVRTLCVLYEILSAIKGMKLYVSRDQNGEYVLEVKGTRVDGDLDTWLGIAAKDGEITFGEMVGNRRDDLAFIERYHAPLDTPDLFRTLLAEILYCYQPDRPFAKAKVSFAERMPLPDFRKLERYLEDADLDEAMTHLGM
jgi:hypothetical protein